MLVAIEGNSGAGKTTLINNLKILMKDETVVTTECYSTKSLKNFIRNLRDTGFLEDPKLYEYLQLLDLFCKTSVMYR